MGEGTGVMSGGQIDNDKLQSLKSLTTVIYGLYALTWFFGVSAIVAVVMNYVKRDEAAGTWLESHFLWQIRTFWYALLWAVIGGATFIFGIGWIILMVNVVWCIYRLVKGWLNLNDNKPMYSEI